MRATPGRVTFVIEWLYPTNKVLVEPGGVVRPPTASGDATREISAVPDVRRRVREEASTATTENIPRTRTARVTTFLPSPSA
jgi:uncharacterized NAD(P)/FAD-binding protein YdhS